MESSARFPNSSSDDETKPTWHLRGTLRSQVLHMRSENGALKSSETEASQSDQRLDSLIL